jgi:enoyl-CoA hydratase/carnithine racemase
MAFTEKLRVEASDGIGRLILNNPEKRNAIGFEMWRDLPEALGQLENDSSVRVVVVTGAGDKAFSAGADISEFAERRSTPENRELYTHLEHEAFEALRGITKLTVARVDGVCVGGGAEVAMDCDLQIASDRSRFAVTPARIGLGYGVADVTRLVRQVGPKHAKEILTTGRFYDAEEAHRIGWINHVVPAAELDEFVEGYALGVAANAPLSVKAAKLMVNELVKDPADRDIALCERLVEDCYTSADYVEGQRAFGEKRPPEFEGR